MQSDVPSLAQTLRLDCVSIIAPATKAEALDMTARLFEGHPAIRDFAAFRGAIHQREGVVSTGIGLGVAVPHVKIPEVTDYVLAVARCVTPIDFDSIDGEPVRLIFMIGASHRAALTYVRFLAQVVKLVRDDACRAALLQAESAARMHAIVVAGAA
jgi:mannitol/fructose-specific phosphotransferase system IIA component (Ntr-type)